MGNPLIDAIFGAIDGPLDKILGRFFPSADDRQKAKLEIQAELLKQEGALQAKVLELQAAQIDVNKEEAKSASLFVAGWRPAVGWVCVFAMAWQYVLQPMLTWGFAVYHANGGQTFPALPTLETSQMYAVLFGLLGLGGLRTVEKLKGEVDRSSLSEP